MLRSLKKLFGDKLGASDGELGHVKDFYFDDLSWAVRYLVVDTGKWLPGRQVLLAPHAFGNFHEAGKVLAIKLTRKQIENAPPIDTHKPVSRQCEEEYYRYFGWPYYWQGDGLWGMSGFPVLQSSAKLFPDERDATMTPPPERADAHLRSTEAVNGYHLQATDGIVGHVADFLMDARSWAIGQIVVKTGHRFSGREVQVSVNHVDRISYEKSTVFVDMTMAAVEESATPALAAAA
jgi:hypothetical protein